MFQTKNTAKYLFFFNYLVLLSGKVVPLHRFQTWKVFQCDGELKKQV